MIEVNAWSLTLWGWRWRKASPAMATSEACVGPLNKGSRTRPSVHCVNAGVCNARTLDSMSPRSDHWRNDKEWRKIKFSDKYSAKHFYFNLKWLFEWSKPGQQQQPLTLRAGEEVGENGWMFSRPNHLDRFVKFCEFILHHSSFGAVVGNVSSQQEGCRSDPPFCVEFAHSPLDCMGSPATSGLRPTRSSKLAVWVSPTVICFSMSR